MRLWSTTRSDETCADTWLDSLRIGAMQWFIRAQVRHNETFGPLDITVKIVAALADVRDENSLQRASSGQLEYCAALVWKREETLEECRVRRAIPCLASR